MRRFSVLSLLMLLISILPLHSLHAAAPDSAPTTLHLAHMPILHEGRIKPLDSFARDVLKTVSGQEKNAMAWMTEALFDPARSEIRPIIRVRDPNLLHILKLEPRKSRLYSYVEISKALSPKQALILDIAQRNEQDWSSEQKKLITLQKNMILLRDLYSSLSLFLPLSETIPDTAPDSLKPFASQQITYESSLVFRAQLEDILEEIYSKRGQKIEEYSEQERSLVQIAFSLDMLSENAKEADIFKVVLDNDNWMTPWQALNDSDVKREKNNGWKTLAYAYHSGQNNIWNETTQKMVQIAYNKQPIRALALKTEYYYNLFSPFKISFSFCFLGLVALVASLFFKRAIVEKIATSSLALAFMAQSAGILSRIYILDRPPVSTLYETTLFVNLIVIFYALLAFSKHKTKLWLWCGLGLGILIGILGSAHDGTGDNFLVLTAVLNTNFWLSTHVLTITSGYALCTVASLLAHYVLLNMIYKKQSFPDFDLFRHVMTASLLALFLMTTGTILGGIWADQSWGRFWGWDPKENGALLIVFWLLWLLHGQISAQLKKVEVLYGLSFLSVILALSWFGVNMLGVGLHSYGFSDQALWSLASLITGELVFLAFCFLKLKGLFKDA